MNHNNIGDDGLYAVASWIRALSVDSLQKKSNFQSLIVRVDHSTNKLQNHWSETDTVGDAPLVIQPK